MLLWQRRRAVQHREFIGVSLAHFHVPVIHRRGRRASATVSAQRALSADAHRHSISRLKPVCVQLPMSAVNVALPAFPCSCCRAVDRYLLTAGGELQQRRTSDGTDRQTDGRTPGSCTDPAPHTCRPLPVSVRVVEKKHGDSSEFYCLSHKQRLVGEWFLGGGSQPSARQ